MMCNDEGYIGSGRKSAIARVIFGLLVFTLLVVILGYVSHDYRTLSSWSSNQVGPNHGNLTLKVDELQARFENLTGVTMPMQQEEGLCSLGWIEVNRKCYYISSKGITKNWLRSKIDCGKRRGRLATVKTKTELRALGFFYDRSWIGLSERKTEGRWMWEDGTELQSGFWLKGEPNDVDNNEDCAHLTSIQGKLGFNDNRCNTELSYICEPLG